VEQVFNEAERAEFVWGEWDCANFVAKVIYAKCGKDVAAPFRGKYTDQFGAYRMLREYCGGGLLMFAEKVARVHGFQVVQVSMAQRGDVVAVITGKGCALGVVDLSGMEVAMMHTKLGLIRRPLKGGFRAWRIA
jgi:hypothetical protein